jgi:nitroreductase
VNVNDAIDRRRAYRSLEGVKIADDLIWDLAGHAQLAPSCFNNQPLRMVYVRSKKRLEAMKAALSEGNRWAYDASMIIAVFSRREDDCVIRDRIYHQFDCGLGVGFLMLRATELGLVAHPIAGFSPKKTREILGIPSEYEVIALIIVGKKSMELSPLLSERQIAVERERPARRPVSEIAFIDRYPAADSGEAEVH